MSNQYDKFYNLFEKDYIDKYRIIIEPKKTINNVENDSINWEIDDNIIEFIKSCIKSKDNSFENSIIKIYEYICKNYIYDDNVLYFFRNNGEKHIPADFYGRIIDKQWTKTRKNHNRRICYEFSRMLCKSINMLIKLYNIKNTESFILGLKDNTHYISAIYGTNICAIFDLDDFNKIKDLTRLKLNLTIDGIKIIYDKDNKLENQINLYNNNRFNNIFELIKKEENFINYLYKCVDYFKKVNIDNQGYQEVFKSILDYYSIESNKIWEKETNIPEIRYIRCLLFKLNNTEYLLDSVKRELLIFNKKIIDNNNYIMDENKKYYDYYGG